MDIQQRLRAILNTLCQVEVKGRQNLDFLLACIKAIEAMIQELNERSEEGATE